MDIILEFLSEHIGDFAICLVLFLSRKLGISTDTESKRKKNKEKLQKKCRKDLERLQEDTRKLEDIENGSDNG